MSGYGCTVWVNDNEGKEFICTLDSMCTLDECNEFIGTLDSDRKIPKKLEELTEHERSSCRSSVAVFGM